MGIQHQIFGVEVGRLARELGCGSVAYFPGPLWPVFPCFSLSAPVREKVRVGVEVLRPVPRDPKRLPIAFEEVRDDRGHNFVVRWDGPAEFTDGESRRSLWFNVGALGEAEARRQAWSYFDEMYVARAQVVGTPSAYGGRAFGPLGEQDDGGRRYHGGPTKMFVVWKTPKEGSPKLKVTVWDPREDTFCEGRRFVGIACIGAAPSLVIADLNVLDMGPLKVLWLVELRCPVRWLSRGERWWPRWPGLSRPSWGFPFGGSPGRALDPTAPLIIGNRTQAGGLGLASMWIGGQFCSRPRKRREGPRWLPWPRRELLRCCTPMARLMCCGIVGVSRVQGCERLACGSAPRGSSWPGLTRSRAR